MPLMFPGSSRALDIFLPALLYNTGRVISYTAIGFLLGLVGMLLGCRYTAPGFPIFSRVA